MDAAELAAHPIVQMEGTPWDDGEGFRELYWSSEAQHLNNSENVSLRLENSGRECQLIKVTIVGS